MHLLGWTPQALIYYTRLTKFFHLHPTKTNRNIRNIIAGTVRPMVKSLRLYFLSFPINKHLPTYIARDIWIVRVDRGSCINPLPSADNGGRGWLPQGKVLQVNSKCFFV